MMEFGAVTIAKFAFQKFIETGAGELAKKFTETAISKMDDLRKLIWSRLQGKYPQAAEALPKAETGDQEAIKMVAKLLEVEMLDPSFATQVQSLAKEINAGKLVDQSNMTQINQGSSRGWQTKVEGGTAYIGEITQNFSDSHPKQQ